MLSHPTRAPEEGVACASEGSPLDADGGPSRSRRLIVGLVLAAIVGLFATRCLQVARTDSITCDEATHLVHCLHYWMTGDDLTMWELGAPRLPHAMGALASYLGLEPAGLLPAVQLMHKSPSVRQ